jgi:hypothetical protein
MVAAGGGRGASGAVAQGILPFVFEAMPEPNELTARAGLTLVAETLLAMGLEEEVADRLQVRARDRGYREFDKLQALVLIQAAGGDCVEDVRVLAADQGLTRLLGRPWPSPDALHDFLAAFHDEGVVSQRPPTGAWIPPESGPLQALAAINTTLVSRAASVLPSAQATLDLDATVIESHKRDALPHYKGGRGYQPVAVLWVEPDLVVADEYRDGNVPAGMATLPVARRALATVPTAVGRRYFRGDSACYEEALLKHLVAEGVQFTISADMSPELRRLCMRPEVQWAALEERVTETVAWADVEFAPGAWAKTAAPLRYVALRFAAHQGQLFAGDPKYLAVVTNRWDLEGAALVRWHWEKAGTIEHTHDITKNDLAGGNPPSGRFGANAAWYRLTLLTYNVLSVLRGVALPERFRSARPKRLRYEVFTVPAVLRSHARQLTARLGVPAVTAAELIATRDRLLDLRRKLAPAS